MTIIIDGKKISTTASSSRKPLSDETKAKISASLKATKHENSLRRPLPDTGKDGSGTEFEGDISRFRIDGRSLDARQFHT